MASKFQNRLVGTIILVALGVIILPGLLDGKKKHYEDEFASIPLVPKPGDTQEQDVVPSVSQSLPAQPPEGAVEAVHGKGNTVTQPANSGQELPDDTDAQPLTPVSPVTQNTEPPKQVQPARPAPTKPKVIEPKPMVEAKPVEKPKPVHPKPIEQPKVTEQPKAVEPPKVENKPQVEEKAPAGQSYVVQLGALNNASKANEIVASLRLSGFRAYTVPSTPVQGKITRIFVGPDASKQKLESSLPQLNKISGLSGQVRSYNAGK
ncbi:cell division protein DedD [Ewingella sp. S1.OA.A_B6]